MPNLSFDFIKIGFLIANFLYIIFAFIILNQVVSMNNIISEVHASSILKTIAVLNIVFALSLFLIALVIL